MAKDLTNSRLDRQNILNNEVALDEIQQKSGIDGILWDGKIFVTREMTANFFEVDIRTISRYLEQNGEELSANGYQVLRGKRLKAFLESAKASGKDICVPTKTTVLQFLLFNGYMGIAKNFMSITENISYHVAAGKISKDLLHKIMTAIMDGTYEQDETLKIEIMNAIAG